MVSPSWSRKVSPVLSVIVWPLLFWVMVACSAPGTGVTVGGGWLVGAGVAVGGGCLVGVGVAIACTVGAGVF
jgi:hypothetical protein